MKVTRPHLAPGRHLSGPDGPAAPLRGRGGYGDDILNMTCHDCTIIRLAYMIPILHCGHGGHDMWQSGCATMTVHLTRPHRKLRLTALHFLFQALLSDVRLLMLVLLIAV